MGIVELPVTGVAYFTNHKSRGAERRAAFVEAAVIEAVDQSNEDPELQRAIKMVAASVKHLLSPRALGYLESTLESDERSGSIRWRELARLDLWLRKAHLPEKASRAIRGLPYNRANDTLRKHAMEHPLKLIDLRRPMVPGRTVAAIYGIAKRAKVRPGTVVAALLNFGLERVAQALRDTREIPPTITREMNDAFPIAEAK